MGNPHDFNKWLYDTGIRSFLYLNITVHRAF
jgi:hypothetical protein